MRWLITYDYRLHRRPGTGAIFLDVEKGTRSEIIDTDPVSWFEIQAARWRTLEEKRGVPGEAMTGIVVRLAVNAGANGQGPKEME